MLIIVDIIVNGLAGSCNDDKQARAWSYLGTLIGGVNISRAMKTTKAADGVATAIVEAAVKVAGRTRIVN